MTQATAKGSRHLSICLASVLAVVCAGLPTSAALASTSETRNSTLVDIISSINAGQFTAAETAIDKAMAEPGLAAPARNALAFERERMRRILLDFTLDEATLKAQLRKKIPDLNDAEFARWKAQGLFEQQSIDGRVLYFQRAASNLFRLSPEALARRSEQTPLRDGPMEAANAHHREILDAAGPSNERGLASRKLKVTQTLSVHADAVPSGEIVRAWIPYPRALPGQQDDIQFLKSAPEKPVIAPETALQRTVYLERSAEAGKPTEFSISYELTISAQSHAIDANRVVTTKITPELAPFVAERPPHIVFNQGLRLFSRQIVGDEKNPWRIAQKLFAAVDQIPWAGAREYSTISNISEYALHAGHADCGQQTMLLMALLRLNGIPSRWQSGLVYSEGSDYWNLHDWGQLYITPYGWIPMDVTTGRLASDDPRVTNFYLGGLDAYRIVFNDDYGRDFVPAKTFFRSETVDLQRGEAEWSGGNLYFDQWDYDFDWQVSPVKP